MVGAANSSAVGALDDLRILDVSGPIGHYAGRLLADLGADVIKVEPRSGDAARSYGPFLPDVDAPEDGLQFLLLNANKRGVTIDVASERGRDLFLRLVASADVVIDSWRPQEAAALRLTHDDLVSAKPDVIHASVTGWGLTGPRAEWAYADIVALAMSGVMALAGLPDGPPERLPDLQGYHCASIDAAAGVMAALLHRDLSGEGQLVEVSMQEALSMAQETAMQFADILGSDRVRGSTAAGNAAVVMPGVGLHEAADGYLYLMAGGNAGSGFGGLLDLIRQHDGLRDLDEEPYASFIATGMNRVAIAQAVQDPEQAKTILPMLAHVDDVVRDFLRGQPKEHVYETGQEMRVLVGMVSDPRDISTSKQLAARDWWIDLDDPGRDATLRYPGPPWQLRGTPATLRRPAPLLGEHNDEVFAELGLSAPELASLVAAEAV